MLQELKSQNQEIVETVERAYMEALKVFNTSLSPRLRDKVKDSPRISVQYIPNSEEREYGAVLKKNPQV